MLGKELNYIFNRYQTFQTIKFIIQFSNMNLQVDSTKIGQTLRGSSAHQDKEVLYRNPGGTI